MGWMMLPDRAAEPTRLFGAPSGGRTAPKVGTLAQLAARLFPVAVPAANPVRHPTQAVPPAALESDVGSRRAAAEISADDRNLLFAAVTERLRSSVDASQPVLRGTVLDCVEALERLQSAMAQEREQVLLAEHALRRARHEADHDSLTLLPNRSHFQTRLGEALNGPGQGTAPLAVLFLDLDGFKPINDRHGHDAGDELLRIVARRLSRSVRADDMVCRLGGDEFACMLSNVMGRQQLSQLAAKLFDAVSAPLKVGELTLTVRPSIGIAHCPTDGTTAASLLKCADAAMNCAKRLQLGYAFFEPGAEA